MPFILIFCDFSIPYAHGLLSITHIVFRQYKMHRTSTISDEQMSTNFNIARSNEILGRRWKPSIVVLF
jgi:hypothetical protein